MLPVTMCNRLQPPITLHFGSDTKLKLHILGREFFNVTKSYKVPVKSVTSGVYKPLPYAQ